jgi:hypothetical protein
MRVIAFAKYAVVGGFIPRGIVQAVRCVEMFPAENGNPVIHNDD